MLTLVESLAVGTANRLNLMDTDLHRARIGRYDAAQGFGRLGSIWPADIELCRESPWQNDGQSLILKVIAKSHHSSLVEMGFGCGHSKPFTGFLLHK